MAQVATTIVMVIKELLNEMRTKVPNMKATFDPGLSYESGTKLLRSANRLKSRKQEHFPQILWNRSVLRYDERMGKRGIHKAVVRDVDTFSAAEYRAALGEFDFRFAFVSPNMSTIENFEIMYFGKESFKNLYTTSINVPGLEEPLTYHLNWGDLEDVVMDNDQWFIKLITGMCTITGLFLTLRSQADLKLVETIYFDIYNNTASGLISQNTITS